MNDEIGGLMTLCSPGQRRRDVAPDIFRTNSLGLKIEEQLCRCDRNRCPDELFENPWEGTRLQSTADVHMAEQATGLLDC